MEVVTILLNVCILITLVAVFYKMKIDLERHRKYLEDKTKEVNKILEDYTEKISKILEDYAKKTSISHSKVSKEQFETSKHTHEKEEPKIMCLVDPDDLRVRQVYEYYKKKFGKKK